jgi:hypothetical protein
MRAFFALELPDYIKKLRMQQKMQRAKDNVTEFAGLAIFFLAKFQPLRTCQSLQHIFVVVDAP